MTSPTPAQLLSRLTQEHRNTGALAEGRLDTYLCSLENTLAYQPRYADDKLPHYREAYRLPGLTLDQAVRLARHDPSESGLTRLLLRSDLTEEALAALLLGTGRVAHPLRTRDRSRCARNGWLVSVYVLNGNPRKSQPGDALAWIRQVRAEFNNDPLLLAVLAEIGAASLSSMDEVIRITRLLGDWLNDTGGHVGTLRDTNAFTAHALEYPPTAATLDAYAHYLGGRTTAELTADHIQTLMGAGAWNSEALRQLGDATFAPDAWTGIVAALCTSPSATLEFVSLQLWRSSFRGRYYELEEQLRSRGSLIPVAHTLGSPNGRHFDTDIVAAALRAGYELLEREFGSRLDTSPALRQGLISLEADWAGTPDELLGVYHGLLA